VVVTLDLESSGIWDEETAQLKPSKYTGMTVHVKDSYCVYGDTDSVFIKFNMFDMEGHKLEKLDAVSVAIALCKKAVKEISAQLKRPQNIEFEKAIYPFILISKKRYHGHYYTKIDNPNFYANSMGIVTKRRDNAPIVKHVFGGALDIIMNEHDITKAYEYVKTECQKILHGEFPLDEFIVSKTLRSYYKKPRQIAHNVLAMRQAQRDPGNRFENNDRVPYAFVVTEGKNLLQGDKIETPTFIQQNKLTLNYKMYITNQIMKPVAQIFELVPGFANVTKVLTQMLDIYENERTGGTSMDLFIKKKVTPTAITKLSDLIKVRKEQQVIIDEDNEADSDSEAEAEVPEAEADEDEEAAVDADVEDTSNYEDPNF